MDHSQDPCPWVILKDVGIAYCMGGIGGAIWYGVKSLRSSPVGERRIGAVTAIKAQAPLLAGHFGAFTAMFSASNYAMRGTRRKDDPYNASKTEWVVSLVGT